MKRPALILIFTLIPILFFSCGKKKLPYLTKSKNAEEAAYSPNKDAEIQRYNLKVKEDQAEHRTPYDTLSLISYVLNNYPQGTYLVNFDKTLTFNVPEPAVIYLNREDGKYVLAVIARSKPGERLIEPKNIIGYDQSYIDLDSTKLGTAFFYLSLFKCSGGTFNPVWEAPIPSHGGFNNIEMKKWAYNGTEFIKTDFYYARGSGHIDYNYFLINGLTKFPHLLMTYKGINFERTLANVNSDAYPDYYEHIFYDYGNMIFSRDSVAFVWNKKDSLYVSTRNRRQTRPY